MPFNHVPFDMMNLIIRTNNMMINSISDKELTGISLKSTLDKIKKVWYNIYIRMRGSRQASFKSFKKLDPNSNQTNFSTTHMKK